MISRVHSAQPSILGAHVVTIETDLSRGLYSFTVVGLPDKAVEEARERISAAIKNSGFESPKSKNHKIIISLAPADLRKEGPLFDLPMALCYLIASGAVRAQVAHTLLVGELSLDGTIRPIRGTLPIVRKAQQAGFTHVIVPMENAPEASLIPDIHIFGARHLREVIQHLDTSRDDHHELPEHPHTTVTPAWGESSVFLEDIKGQESAKRGLLIAAAGRHNAIMIGPPGTGKTMLARAFQSILPPLTTEEMLEVTAIHSIAGTSAGTPIVTVPPFRAPHHTASHTALVGGGTHPRPGEVTLAHRGVLFLDEFPEFDRRSIDSLRQPLEDRVVSISRIQGTAHFPADFILLAAMNPHRGTYDNAEEGTSMIDAYKKKISGPIMDRIDLWLSVSHVRYTDLTPGEVTKTPTRDETTALRAAVLRARATQASRFQSTSKANATMSARDIEAHIPLSSSNARLLADSAAKLSLSPRGYHRVIKVARTIADLDDAEHIDAPHILEALQYRSRA